MLRLEDVHTRYGNIEALKGVSLDVANGEIVTIIGANGAGKSTLLMTVCGAPRAASGRILFEERDITALARSGKIDPVIGRDNEIRRVLQVLARRSKNNPVLIGEPGVGKTAIVEGIGKSIVQGDVRERIKDKKIL